MVILLFGPPGCGKGTQGRLIIDWLPVSVPSISTGEMLRAEIAADTALGLATKETIVAGGLVPDDLMNQIVQRRISQPDCREGFMLDGFPRTVRQAEFLDAQLAKRGMSQPVVIHLDAPTEVLVNRIICRRQCRDCGAMYNVLSKRPKAPGRCDNCRGNLIVRPDDREEIIRERLRAYKEQTQPVLTHYEEDHYCRIEGDRSPRYIFDSIRAYLDQFVAAGVR